MRIRPKNNSRKGAALLVTLFVVIFVTLGSMAFLARSDGQLLCGKNMALRVKMDYLADSGLSHAKALVVSPDNAGVFAGGDVTAVQLETSDDYYDVTIDAPVLNASSDPNLPATYTYSIQCQAYRLQESEKAAQSSLTAQLYYDTADNSAMYKSVKR